MADVKNCKVLIAVCPVCGQTADVYPFAGVCEKCWCDGHEAGNNCACGKKHG